MTHAVHRVGGAVAEGVEGEPLGHIGLDALDTVAQMGQVVPGAGDDVVDDDNPVSPLDQPIDQVGPDEPRPTGHDHDTLGQRLLGVWLLGHPQLLPMPS